MAGNSDVFGRRHSRRRQSLDDWMRPYFVHTYVELRPCAWVRAPNPERERDPLMYHHVSRRKQVHGQERRGSRSRVLRIKLGNLAYVWIRAQCTAGVL